MIQETPQVDTLPPEHDPALFDADDAADSLGITPQAFRRWQVKPTKTANGRAYFTAAAILENRRQHAARKRATERRPTGTPAALLVEIEQAETEAMKLRATLADLRTAKRRGDLLSTDELAAIVASAASQAAAGLQALPAELKRKDPRIITAVLTDVRALLADHQNALADKWSHPDDDQ